MSKNPINPSHYKQYPIEVIDMIISIWGIHAAINFCTITAFTYRSSIIFSIFVDT